MRIEGIVWLRSVADKLAAKHGVETWEVEELLNNRPKFRFVEKRVRAGENVYAALGRTEGGRYLLVLFIYKRTRKALLISARKMAVNERRLYAKT